MSKIIPPGTKVRSTTPELAGHLGTIQPETVETPNCWVVEAEDGPLLPCDDEAQAVETWEICEFELGLPAIVHRARVTPCP